MKLLAHFLASLLVTAICTATFVIVCDHTIFSSHYLQQKAAQTNTYSRLSTALSAQVSQESGGGAQAQSVLQTQLLTPALMKQRVNSAFDELQAFYQGSGQLPSINLSPYISQAKAAGVQVPATSQLNQPLTLVKGAQAQGLGKQLSTIRIISVIALVLLIAVLIVLSVQQRRYTIVPDAFVVAGFFLAISAMLLIVIPDLANKYFALSFNNNALASIARDLIDAITHDMGRILGITAGVMLVLGGIAHFLLARLQRQRPPSLPAGQSLKV